MLRSALIISIVLLISMMSRAQVAEYYFTQQNQSYTEITGGTQLWSGTFDNDISGAITIPSFNLNGTAYTSLYISANGFITFGSAPTATTYTPLSSTGTYNASISAFGCNLAQAATGSPEVRYQQVSNEFVIQWKDVRRTGISGEIISFQIRLNTNNNTFTFVYGGTINPGSNSTYPQVGLRGAANTDFNTRYITNTGGNWINSTGGTTNSRTLYFNSVTPAVVPTAGLTFSWKPLYNPTYLTTTAINQNQINLGWTNNVHGHDVLVAFNTTSTFGTPINGTSYSAGNTITGGGTVLFVGDATSFNHTSLSASTQYFYKIWSCDASTDYSTGVTSNSRTAYPLPYLQDFNTTSLPAEWTTNMSSVASHGTTGTRAMSKQIASSATEYSAISPMVGSINSTTNLSFHYRIVDDLGYPLNATELGETNQIEIQVSTNDGATFTTIDSIDQTNHTITTEFTNKVVSLASYSGNYIKVRFLCKYGSGNYHVDIDNVLFEDGTNMSFTASTTEQPNTTKVAIGSSYNEIVRLQVVTQKSSSPLSVTSITFNTTGCTSASADLETARVYFTTTPVFSTVNSFGSAVSSPTGTLTFTGSQTLAQGINYFWLAFDTRSSATAGNVIDAQCTQFVTSESGTVKVPTTTSPTGTRTIGSVFTGTKAIPGDYATIAAAVTDLNSGVVGSGGVTFNVAAGHTETITAPILLTTTGTSANRIVFQKSGSGSNPLVTRTDAGTVSTSSLGNHGDGIIIIEGADYVTFDGISVAASNQGVEYGYYLRKASVTDGCNTVSVKNANIAMTKGTSRVVVGICVANNSSSSSNISLTQSTGRHENITITGDTVSNVFSGIYLKGSGTYCDQNFTVGTELAGNVIRNFAGNVSSTSYGIFLQSVSASSVGYNSINNTTGGGSEFTTTGYGIYNEQSTATDFTAGYNSITLASVSSAITGIHTGIDGVLNLNHNTISISNTTSSTAQFIFIYNDQSYPDACTISDNTFASSTIFTTGPTYLIENDCYMLEPGVINVERNVTSGSINRTGTSGLFFCYSDASVPTGQENISSNLFSNITLAGTSSFWGIVPAYTNIEQKLVQSNTFSNITGGSGATNFIYCEGQGNVHIGANLIHTSTGAGIVNGINIGGNNGTHYLQGNIIYDLSSTSTSGTGGLVNGILVGSGTTVYVFNNFISDLKAPNAINSDAIRGISVTSTLANSTVGVYYNTVYLNASSVSTNFGSSGIYHTSSSTATTAKLDLRNNIIVNVSTPTGSASTVAFRRSTSTMTNYASTSNNNIFYAGVPGSNRLIATFQPCQTIEIYRSMVGPNRDSVSFSEMPPFINASSAPYDLRLSGGASSYCESGAQPVTTPLNVLYDYDGTLRGSNPDIGADEFAGIPAYVAAPSLLTAKTLNSQQIELVFKPNTNSDTVVVIFNTSGVFTTPSGRPVEGEPSGGGTVLYSGIDTTVVHSSLTPGTAVYYKAYSYNGASYSTALSASTTPTVTPASDLIAMTSGRTQINLSWNKNVYGHDVIVTSDSVFRSGNPINNTPYSVGEVIPSGGTVIYKGVASEFDHTGLDPWSQLFYKIWSVDEYNYYSTGITANAITNADTITELPYLQNFDGTWEHSPAAPLNWLVVDVGGSGTFTWVKDTYDHSPPYGAHGYGSGTCNDYLISPPVRLPDTLCQIGWWDRVSSATSNNSYKVLLSLTDNNPASFTVELGDINCTNTDWTQHFIDLGIYKGLTVYIAFYQYYSQSQYENFAIDDVVIETLIPTESELDFPSNGLHTFVNPKLVWKAPVTAEPITGYRVYLDQNSNPSTLVYEGLESSFQTPGLMNGTTYYWKVIPYNGYGEAMNVPVWSFTTVTVTQLAESFEADFFPPVGWNIDYGWIYTNSTSVHGNNAGRRLTTASPVKLITPLLEISSGDKLEFFEGTSSSTYQRIQIMYSTDKTNWSNLGSPILLTPADWGFHSIDLETLAGGNYYLAFAAYYAEGGSASYIYIDHVTGPNIVPVATLAALNPNPFDTDQFIPVNCNLSWDPDNDGGIPSGYKLYFDTNTNPSTLVYTGVDPSFNASGLLANTTYYWKVVPFNAIGDAAGCPVWSFTTVAEGAVQIGQGDIDYFELPVTIEYDYGYTQTIYLQSEIQIADKRITKLYYHWTGVEEGTAYKDWVVYMGHTSKSAFVSTTDWVPMSEMTQVFSGEVNIPATDSWVEIILDVPFNYNNTDNLVIAVDENTTGYTGTYGAYFYGTEFTEMRGLKYRSDGSNPDPATPPEADARVDGIANIRLVLENLPKNAVFKITPDSKDFGIVPLYASSDSQVFTIRNIGSEILVVQSLNLTGTDASSFQLTDTNSYPVNLENDDVMTISVLFDPASVGVKQARLDITDNLSPVAHEVQLSGTAVDPMISMFPFTETFEDDSPTRNKWWHEYVSGKGDWIYIAGAGGGSITTAHGGLLNARFPSTGTTNVTKLLSPILDLSDVANPVVSFWYGQEVWSAHINELKVYYRTASDQPWVELYSDNSNVEVWSEQSFALPNKSATYQLAFEGIDNYGQANVVDDVTVQSDLSVVVIPTDSTLANIELGTEQSECYNATQTITVAGSGTTVYFLNGSMATIIAGQSIRFLPGFHAQSGSQVYATITTTGTFCDEIGGGSPIVANPDEKSVAKKETPNLIPSLEKSIRVYPNPNNGRFTLELTNVESGATVSIYNMLGVRVHHSATTNGANHKINLTGIKKGIYFVKVMDGKEQFTKKMVVD